MAFFLVYLYVMSFTILDWLSSTLRGDSRSGQCSASFFLVNECRYTYMYLIEHCHGYDYIMFTSSSTTTHIFRHAVAAAYAHKLKKALYFIRTWNLTAILWIGYTYVMLHCVCMYSRIEYLTLKLLFYHIFYHAECIFVTLAIGWHLCFGRQCGHGYVVQLHWLWLKGFR